MFLTISKHLRDFAAGRTGNVAMIFALAALPLMGSVGLAVDYGSMLSVKAKLDQAADAAAIAGIAGTQTYLKQYTGQGSPTSAAITAGESQATAQFNANTGRLANGTLTSSQIRVARSGPVLTGTVSYSYTMPTFFMAVLGSRNVTFSGTSTSTLTMPTYVNLYIILDNSSSMGIGATANDQKIVYNTTKNKLTSSDAAYACAIACHYANTNTSSPMTDTTAMVRNAGASLRIDAAKQAIYSALGQIPTSSTVQIGVYTMSNGLTKVFPTSSMAAVSNDITTARTYFAPKSTNANSIDLSNANNDGGTDTTDALKTLNNALPTPGDGLTQATALGYVMLITDAVQDSDSKNWVTSGTYKNTYQDKADPNFSAFSPCNQSSCWLDPTFNLYFESFDPAQCAPLKTKGYTMMTLDAEYLVPDPTMQSTKQSLKDVFTYIQTYLISSTAANMQTCATSADYAFKATTPDQIAAKTTEMFGKIPAEAKARLSR